ncbi:polyribonucleotide nucleotidyltransferase [Helicobacter typhlonius]|uniref:Polyribonucleotide nucleotidyltransferase n=5 Tax=Helicobacter typhlonius TaxID=76936 RepID=A0A099UG62_9HELI|nr:polyribonucleotide nucleotidyltransferase [Helicobacter typhlonius]TLD79134.1 polyribonucleotide nucleotidyltransferase [Helicobacter typhlonius]CUU40461.1 Polyribonucleotide nucleotidyltransferase [Helicobacter typhlonius]
MRHIEINLENLHERYSLEYVAKAANGAILYQNGGSVLLASVCTQEDEELSEDFVPLSVQYIEKSYAKGKFPAGFIKREGKPSEFEILTSRLIDRTLRPLFPKGYGYNTSITILVLSYDGKSDLALNALNAAAAALYISNLPLESLRENAVSGVRIGRINGAFVINPNTEEIKQSECDIFISGRGDELLMIEMKSLRTNDCANELSEEEFLSAIELAKNYISKATKIYHQQFAPYKKPPLHLEISQKVLDSELQERICREYRAQMSHAIDFMAKSESLRHINALIAQVAKDCALEQSEAQKYVLSFKRQYVREMILDLAKRADGRGLCDVRPISIETNILPFAHGSVLFTRGQTQALVSATIGIENDAQSYERLGSKVSLKKHFLFHYNFPPFSVGEAGIIGSVGRRELGHGNLARNALHSSVQESKKTIRLVSEILESNGSSSMASVCGGSLALCACGIGVDSLIAGVAMGLVSEGEKYAVLTDISGLEDHDGDMDFKVAGGYKGITAMQMDIKLGGITQEILKKALLQAKDARIHILNIMESARAQIVLNDAVLPKSESFMIPPHKIVEVIGAGGRVIKDIIERFGVNIDLVRDSGMVSLNADNAESVQKAKTFIMEIVGNSEKIDWGSYEVGERFIGKIKKIADFGVFIELPRGGDGLVHISKITQDRGQKLSDILQDVSELECEILSQNKNKVELGLVKS